MSAKIIIADDEPHQLELLRYNLTKAGFTVLQASDGDAALRLVEETHPDLVVLDWMMPGLSGVDICRELRARAETKAIPIVILSARGEENNRAMGLDMGADDYIVKPFSPRELVARIKALLRRAHPARAGGILEYHGLRLDASTMQVERDGEPIKVSARAFRLLSILMEQPERVFSRQQLLDMVWGHGIYVEERTVDVHMSRLRKAVNKRRADGGARPDMVRTVRGAGYALAPPENKMVENKRK